VRQRAHRKPTNAKPHDDRAGTSRGPFFLRDWLPDDDVTRDEALIGAIGASDLPRLDGVGGGISLTSKVAIVSPSPRADCDVDHLFAQVGVSLRSTSRDWVAAARQPT
jgi:2-methylaconitate cis-trans-isomerase PrpF